MGDIRSNNWEDGIQVSILGLFEMPHFETLITVSLLIVVFIYLFLGVGLGEVTQLSREQ